MRSASPRTLPGEVGAALQSLVPSFQPAAAVELEFRGPGPPGARCGPERDQVLVLVNGKRRHTTRRSRQNPARQGHEPGRLQLIPSARSSGSKSAGRRRPSTLRRDCRRHQHRAEGRGRRRRGAASWGQNRTDFKPTGKSVNDGDTRLLRSMPVRHRRRLLNLTVNTAPRPNAALRPRPDPVLRGAEPANLALAGTQTKRRRRPMDTLVL